MRTHVFETTAGWCGIAWREGGVARFTLPSASAEGAVRQLARRAPGAEPAAPPAEIAAVIAAVRRYFDGEAVDLSGPPLALDDPDPFALRVYAAVRALPWGTTTSYGAVAQAL